jgi:hypothetical protein
MNIYNIFGWILYVINAYFTISGFIYFLGAAKYRQVVTPTMVCHWIIVVICFIVFGLTDINKLHLIWLLPIGYIFSYTPVGQKFGLFLDPAISWIFRFSRISQP